MKKHNADQDKVLDAELTELQVQITSTDPECDGYPSLKTDESCEFPLFLHALSHSDPYFLSFLFFSF